VNVAPWPAIAAGIAQTTGVPFKLESRTPAGGGCINECYRVAGAGQTFFVKLNSAARLAMFEAEHDGLAEIAATATIRVPKPVCTGADAQHAWLVLEHIQPGEARTGSMARLGEALAQLHRVTSAKFGWRRDNTIGATPQINTETGDWINFWREHRLCFQLALAAHNGAPSTLVTSGERLAADFSKLFASIDIKPSLLHGDLWGGNAAFDRSGAPLVFDPAVYYGHREADIAMTELFGGFSADFHAAYRAAFPLDAGYAVRKQLYNLYHVLNHFNLFGGGYAAQAQALIDGLLAEV